MLSTTAKIARLLFYAAFILVGVMFCVSNRSTIDVTFYPAPFIVSMPLFLFAIGILSFGIALGWVFARLGGIGQRRAHKRAGKRISALENELSALRSERLARTPPKAALIAK